MTFISAAFSTEIDAERVLTTENDYITNEYIAVKFQEFDKGLFQTKWFDYRHMTNLQATKAYIEAYGAVYRRHYAQEFDRERAEHVRVLDFNQMMGALRGDDKKSATKAKSRFVGCWRGRQIADALGMPYDSYIDLAIGYRMRRWKQGYMPQPQHLYHEYDVEKIQARWEEMQTGRIYVAEHPAYLVQNYQGIAHQDDYHEWLFKQAQLRRNPGETLARFINDDQMPYEKAMARSDEYTAEMIKRYLN
jgi:hypothetical protein